MEKLKSFLVTRMLLILLAVLAAEGAVSLLVERVILPVILRLSGDGVTEAVRLRDVLAIAGGALFGNGQQVLLSRIGGSVPVLLLMLCMLLYLFPILAGILFYVRLVTDRVDAMQKERDAERNAYEEQRNLMLSDIAHDLRTPIMTISGYAGALADGMVSSEEQKQEYLEAIRRKSMRLGELINVFFDYVRLGSAHFTLRKKQIDLHEMLLECAAGLYSDVEEAGMELRVEIPETPYPVCADRAQLMRVIWNLLINAIPTLTVDSDVKPTLAAGGAVWYQMRLTFKDELFRCAKVGGEYSFYRNGRRYLLYGWKQCDGDYLNVSDENGNILWQSSIGSKTENAERFISEYLSDRFDF